MGIKSWVKSKIAEVKTRINPKPDYVVTLPKGTGTPPPKPLPPSSTYRPPSGSSGSGDGGPQPPPTSAPKKSPIETQRAMVQERKEELKKEREFVKEFKKLNIADRRKYVFEQSENARRIRAEELKSKGKTLSPKYEKLVTNNNVSLTNLGTSSTSGESSREGSIAPVNSRDFALAGVGEGERPPTTFKERLFNVPKNAKSAFRNIITGENIGDSFTNVGTGFGLFNIPIGPKKTDIPVLTPARGGTTLDPGFKFQPSTLGEQQTSNILAGGYIPTEIRVSNISKKVTSEYQSKVNKGELTVEQAQLQADKEIQRKLGSTDFQSQVAIRKRATTDLSGRVGNVADFTVPAFTASSFIIAPQATSTAFGIDLFSSSTQRLGTGVLNKELTTSQRGKEIFIGTGQLALGATMFGGVTGSIAREVDIEGLKYLEQKVKISTGKRVKTSRGTIDIISGKGKSSSGSLSFETTLLTKSSGKESLTLGKGTSTLNFFSFEKGKPFTSITQFNVKAVGTGLAGSPIKQFKSVIGTGEIIPTSQISFTPSIRREIYSTKGSPLQIVAPQKSRAYDFQLTKFDNKKNTFDFASLGRETKSDFYFFSGKPTSFVSTSKDVGTISVSPTRTGVTQDFFVTEEKLLGGGFRPQNIGRLSIVDTSKVSSTAGSNIVGTSGRKSSQSFIQSLKPTFTATPTTFSEQIVKTTTDLATPTTTRVSRITGASILNQQTQSNILGSVNVNRNNITEASKSKLNLGLANLLRTSPKSKQTPKLSTSFIQPLAERQNIIQKVNQQQKQQQKTKLRTASSFNINNPRGGMGVPIQPRVGLPFGLLPFNLKKPKNKGMKGKGKGKKAPRRSPSLLAIGTGIFAPTRARGEYSGLVVRPIIRSKPKSKRRLK